MTSGISRVDDRAGVKVDDDMSWDDIFSSASTPIIVRKGDYEKVYRMNLPAIELFEGNEAPKADPRVGDFGQYELSHKQSGKMYLVRVNTINNCTGTYIIQTFHDITEQKREEEEAKAERREGEYFLKGLGTEIIWQSKQMGEVLNMARIFAPSNYTMTILGETGTGKDLVARYVHERSKREGRYVDVNSSNLHGTNFVSELFGHMKGSYTGAVSDKKGLLEEANKGTFFLDEIGDMNLEVQAKILRAAETKSFRRMGGLENTTSDFRLIVATNKDLETGLKDGSFREDLYYRLTSFVIEIPPLRERREDIPVLAEHFTSKFSRGETKMSDEAMDLLAAYSWPGNVRELKNIVERAVVLSRDKKTIKEEQIYPMINGYKTTWQPKSLGEVIIDHVNQTLAVHRGNKTKTAEALGVSTRTVRRWLNGDEIGFRGKPICLDGKTTGIVPLHEATRDYAINVLAAYGGNKTKAALALGISRVTLHKHLKSKN